MSVIFPPWRQTPEQRAFTRAQCEALDNHVRRLRGDPWISARDEYFLAGLARQLREHDWTWEPTPKQLKWLWDITDRVERGPPPEPED